MKVGYRNICPAGYQRLKNANKTSRPRSFIDKGSEEKAGGREFRSTQSFSILILSVLFALNMPRPNVDETEDSHSLCN